MSAEGSIKIEERFMKPSSEYPDGSYLRIVGGNVEMATGYFAKQYPDKPSPYWHGKPPSFVVDWDREWPWKENDA